jgi:3-hydroxyisobutyrate dehydrogenase-like beta-hydroxyacid dehydrogenase
MDAERSVAIAGMGDAGGRYAARLLDAGWSVTVWDREPRAFRLAAQGAALARNMAQLAAAADVVLLSLAEPVARDVARQRGLVAVMRRGAVLVDMSPISPESSRSLAAEAAVRDVQMLDVAVSGSTAQAKAGELVLLVGGDEAVLERCRPVLEPLSTAIVHMGGSGAGAASRLVVNAARDVSAAALAEAIVLGEACGLRRDRLLVAQRLVHKDVAPVIGDDERRRALAAPRWR